MRLIRDNQYIYSTPDYYFDGNIHYHTIGIWTRDNIVEYIYPFNRVDYNGMYYKTNLYGKFYFRYECGGIAVWVSLDGTDFIQYI